MDFQIVKLQLAASKAALTQALAEKQGIVQNLATAQKKYDDLLASATQHSEGSTTSLEQASAEVRQLTQQLSDSQTSVDALRASLTSKEAEYSQKLAKAESRATALEAQDGWLKAAAVVAVVELAYIVAHAFGLVK